MIRHRMTQLFLGVGLTLFTTGQSSLAGNRRPRGGAGAGPTVSLMKAPRSPATHAMPVGVLQYDNDMPFSRDGTLDVPIGNRFDRGAGYPGTLSGVSFRLAGCFSTPNLEQQISLFDIDPTAMNLQLLRQFSGGGSCMSTAGTILRAAWLPIPVTPPPNAFVAAVRNTPFVGCDGNTGLGGTCEGVALSEGGIDPGMGFHAIRVSGSQSTVPNLGDRNAIMRAIFSIEPVELMGFDVE
jgi:hypothetical protein